MIRIDFLNFEINNKLYKRLLAVGIVLIVCYSVLTFFYFAIPRVYKMNENVMLDEQNSVKTGINSVYRGSMRLKISGWAYKQGQATMIYNSCYVLKNVETGKMYKIRAQMVEIPELQNVEGQYDCSKSGLEAETIALGMQNGTYDIYILYQNDNENMLVNTGIQANI